MKTLTEMAKALWINVKRKRQERAYRKWRNDPKNISMFEDEMLSITTMYLIKKCEKEGREFTSIRDELKF